MARTRQIKPGFFLNEKLGKLPPKVRLFFIGLWTQADYRGVVEWRPIRLKLQIAPYDKGDVNQWLEMLCEFQFVTKFERNGNSYIHISGFEFHQRISKGEKSSGTTLPDITESTTYETKSTTRGEPEVNPSALISYIPINPNTDIPILSDAADAADKKPKSKKGTRLPDQFFLTTEMREWAAQKKPGVDLNLETEKFCNYFRSAPGTKGVKLDWVLTWKNWILNANGYGSNQNGNTTRNEPTRKTSAERLSEYDFSEFPTEAELAESRKGHGDG